MIEIDKITLKKARLLKGVTQKAVADHFGVSTKTVINWESGKTLCSVKTFKELCAFYGVSMDDVILD